MSNGKHKRRYLPRFVVWSLAIILLAVGSGSAMAQKTKLVVMMPGLSQGVYPDGVIEGFQERFPDIELEILGGPWSEAAKIPVMAAAGTLPDVWYAEAGRASEWGFQGFVEDLRPYIERDLNLNDFFLLDASSDPQGRVWGIPGGFQMTLLYYMTHMFDAAGMAHPDDSWTVTDLIDASKRLTRRDESGVRQYGFDLWPNNGTAGWLLWIHLLGGSVLDETRTHSRLNSPETIRALEFMQDVMWVDEAAPKFGRESGFDLYSNRVAMQFNIYKRTHDLRQRDILTFDVAKIPMAPDGSRYTTVVPNVWMISSTSPVKEAAWEFLKYYISEDVQEKVVAKGAEVPVNRNVSDLFLRLPAPPNNLRTVLESFEFAHTLSENAAWNSWFAAIPRDLAPAFRNEETASSAAERAHQTLQTILDDVYRR